MTIVTMPDLLIRAVLQGYAIGYYESWDQYSLEAAMEAAEDNNAPAIIGFGGAVTNPAWLDHTGVEELATLARCLADHSSVPTAILFNEARRLDQLVRGFHNGCNTLMLDTSHLPFDDNLRLTKEVTQFAHEHGAAVEAELGHLANGTDPAVLASGTDPVEAAQFVAESDVDALAVSIGNVHILSDGEAAVNLDLLAQIRAAVTIPLVIHGGTGYPAAAVRAAIVQGVAKFNVGTRLKQVYIAGIAEAIAGLPERYNIHRIVGSREQEDVFMQGKGRLKAEITRYMHLYGSAGRAKGW